MNAPGSCQYNPTLDKYEHYFVKDEDGSWVCTRCGEREAARPLALAGQIRGVRRT